MGWQLSCGGQQRSCLKVKAQMMARFDCNEVGELIKCVGCKADIDKEERSCLLTQPVLLQSFEDKFDLPEGAFPRTLAVLQETSHCVEKSKTKSHAKSRRRANPQQASCST
jgi:hypothetical protein